MSRNRVYNITTKKTKRAERVTEIAKIAGHTALPLALMAGVVAATRRTI